MSENNNKSYQNVLSTEEYNLIRSLVEADEAEETEEVELSEAALEVQQKISKYRKKRLGYDPLAYKFPERFDNPNKVDDLLLHAVSIKANDIFFKTDNPVRAKKDGAIFLLTKENELLNSTMIYPIAQKICTPTYQNLFTKSYAYNVSYQITRDNGDGTLLEKSFRVNNHRVSNDGMDITMRVINDYPSIDPTIPDEIRDVFRLRNGIILIVGGTGTGKSTLLSSCILDLIEDKSCSYRILTLEAPIEFNYKKIPQIQTFVTQSEVPKDILTFEMGIEETLRRAPDHLLIGEMRDYETIAAGILAAKTNTLVYSTMHVNRVADTIPRIMATTKDTSMILQLLDLMRLICSQDLIEKIGGGRIAVREYLIFDYEIMEIIRDTLNNPDNITAVIDQLVYQHGVLFPVHARFLYRNRQITEETFHKFLKSRNVKITIENMARFDKRVTELNESGNRMFQFTTDDPIPPVKMEVLNDKLDTNLQEDVLNGMKKQLI